MEFLKAFITGGILCAIGQLLIDKTAITPAKLLTGYVVSGVLLSFIGVYQKVVDFAGAGATVEVSSTFSTSNEEDVLIPE